MKVGFPLATINPFKHKKEKVFEQTNEAKVEVAEQNWGVTEPQDELHGEKVID